MGSAVAQIQQLVMLSFNLKMWIRGKKVYSSHLGLTVPWG